MEPEGVRGEAVPRMDVLACPPTRAALFMREGCRYGGMFRLSAVMVKWFEGAWRDTLSPAPLNGPRAWLWSPASSLAPGENVGENAGSARGLRQNVSGGSDTQPP